MTQAEAFEMMKMGCNVFLTGPAGCGKTFLMNRYVKYLKACHIEVAVTATTGIAATHLNGRTIHSWCGMGIDEHLSSEQIEALKEKEHLFRRIRYAKVLMIDEISMLNANRLDLVDQICKIFRQDMRPFGGMQVILCGDFFQLPPVTSRKGDDGRFVTESVIWLSMQLRICYLEEQHRQDDFRFLKILNDIRKNIVTDETRALLTKKQDSTTSWNVIPTKLYTHNVDVDAENSAELSKLPGNTVVFTMHTEGVPHLITNLRDGCLAPERLELKVGAAVMFVKNNFSRGYVNGTRGTITHFESEHGYPAVTTMSGAQIVARPERWTIEEGITPLASLSQVPLRLAWAITVHKSQGMSIDCAEMDLRKTFAFGMGYVALSRVRSLAGMKLTGINPMALKVNEHVLVMDESLQYASKANSTELSAMGVPERKKRQAEFVRRNKEGNVSDGLFPTFN